MPNQRVPPSQTNTANFYTPNRSNNQSSNYQRRPKRINRIPFNNTSSNNSTRYPLENTESPQNDQALQEFRMNTVPMTLEDDVIPYLIKNNYQNKITADIIIMSSYEAAHQPTKKNVIAKAPELVAKMLIQKGYEHIPHITNYQADTVYTLYY